MIKAQAFPSRSSGCWIRRIEVTDSTQDHLVRMLEQKPEPAALLPIGTVIVADTQTKGRGRPGKEWISPEGGLYCSILIGPASAYHVSHMPFICGLAVRDALTDIGIETQIKWPNDIIARRRKLGGILCEKRSGMLIAGIGVNILSSPIPEAISVFELSETIPSRDILLAGLLKFLARRLKRDDTIDEANSALYGKGRKVAHNGEEFILSGLARDGALICARGGDTIEIRSGSIEFRD